MSKTQTRMILEVRAHAEQNKNKRWSRVLRMSDTRLANIVKGRTIAKNAIKAVRAELRNITTA